MDVLRGVHGTLRPGGLLLDVRPTRPESEVVCGGRTLGRRDDSAFFRGVDAAEQGVAELIVEGLYGVQQEIRYTVIDRFDSAEELRERTRASVGSRLPAELDSRVRRARTPPFEIHHSVVARTLRAEPG